MPLVGEALASTSARAQTAATAGLSFAVCGDTRPMMYLPDKEGKLEPTDIIAALSARGLRRVLIEGGAHTLSRFVAAGCLDRLHVVVAPMILGDGLSGLRLPPLDCGDAARRVPMRVHLLGEEVLLDCDLSGQSIQKLREPHA